MSSSKLVTVSNVCCIACLTFWSDKPFQKTTFSVWSRDEGEIPPRFPALFIASCNLAQLAEIGSFWFCLSRIVVEGGQRQIQPCYTTPLVSR